MELDISPNTVPSPNIIFCTPDSSNAAPDTSDPAGIYTFFKLFVRAKAYREIATFSVPNLTSCKFIQSKKQAYPTTSIFFISTTSTEEL